jgi:hypothetical protein
MKMERLEEVFLEAKEAGEIVAVAVLLPEAPEVEVIINHNESIDYKLDYYKKTYDENCVHRHVKEIRLLAAMKGKTYADIEAYFPE